MGISPPGRGHVCGISSAIHPHEVQHPNGNPALRGIPRGWISRNPSALAFGVRSTATAAPDFARSTRTQLASRISSKFDSSCTT
jgi:hypothetical protein